MKGICKRTLPDQEDVISAIDFVHRLGRANMSGQVRPRSIIIQFTKRTARDMLWRAARGNEYLNGNKLRFAEDLSAADRSTRNQLWPQVEAARREGRRAYFVGARAFVDGKEICSQ